MKVSEYPEIHNISFSFCLDLQSTVKMKMSEYPEIISFSFQSLGLQARVKMKMSRYLLELVEFGSLDIAVGHFNVWRVSVSGETLSRYLVFLNFLSLRKRKKGF